MSSLFSQASLAVEPAVYESGKVYATKPFDGSGDLTFTRASGATRVGPDGLIEKVRTNLSLYSQSFATSSTWSTFSGTITNNAGTAPDGTNTASKIVAVNTDPYVYQTLNLSGSVVLSCYVKGIGSSIGKVARILVGASISDVVMDGTWQRITVAAGVAGSELYGLEIPNPAVASDEVLIWGFQVEYGDVATDYIATTSAAVSVGPVSGVPRLDYLGSTCPRLLLEPQRTNLFLYSEQLNTGTSGATVTANQAVSPDGYTNADLITGAGANNYLAKSISGAFTGTHTFSIFLKAGTDSNVGLDIYDGTYYNASYNLATGVATGTGASMVSYGNGWYRCILTRTTSANPVEVSISSIGDGLTIYAWGGQFEASASYATSYVNTLGSSVTRVADACSKTGITSLIGQTEGTLFAELDLKNSPINDSYFLLRNAAVTNYLGINWRNGIIRFETVNAGVLQTAINFSVSTPQTLKVAVAYKSNDFVMYVNGTQVGTNTSATVPTCDILDLNFNGPSFNAFGISQALLFKTRLTNDQLAELTTL